MEGGSPWISVGELAHGFEPDSNSPPQTEDLVGRTLRLELEDGSARELRFETRDTLQAVGFSTLPGGTPTGETYLAFKVREGIYFVDFVPQLERAASESVILDLDRATCLLVSGELPDEAEARRDLLSRTQGGGLDLTSVTARFLSGTVGREFREDTGRYLPTADLIGRRVEYTYSPTERYEHIYLNENLYTWHCLLGVEKGLADTDRCHYYKLADDLYLFVWREKLVPTLGVVIVDYCAMRSGGKIFGYAGDDYRRTSSFAVGAVAARVA